MPDSKRGASSESYRPYLIASIRRGFSVAVLLVVCFAILVAGASTSVPGYSEFVESENADEPFDEKMETIIDEDSPGASMSAGEHSPSQQTTAIQEGENDGGDESDFTATSTNGFVAFGFDTEATAEQEGIDLPEEIQITGEVGEQRNTWESVDTSFPTFQASGLNVAIEAPNGLGGEINLDENHFTMEGQLRVTVAGEAPFEYEIAATSGESGALTGRALFDTEAGGGTMTVVDNEFVVDDETGNSVVDSALSLPSTEPGTNWLELEFDVAFSENLSEQENNTNEDTNSDDMNSDSNSTTDNQESDDTDSDDGSGPGFGVGGAFAGLVGVGYLLQRRFMYGA